MTHSLPPDVEKLLQDLQPEQSFNALRKKAAKELGELSVSDPRIVSALLAVAESDPAPIIRRQAAQSLEAPAQQAVLQQHPDLLEKALKVQATQASQQALPEQEPPQAPTVVCAQCGRASSGDKLHYCPHCGHSLEYAPLVEEAPIQPAPGVNGALLREIRSWGRWSLVLGAMHLLLPGLSVPWGIVLLVVGAASFYFREASMLAVYSITLAWVAISNVFGGVGWSAFAILQFVFAVQIFYRFRKFRQAEAELDGPPDERRAARLFPAAGCVLGAMTLGSTVIAFVSLAILLASTDTTDIPVFFVWLVG